MSKFTQYLKATAIALLVPFSASAQKKAPEKDPVKIRIAALSQSAGKYNLWDERKPTDYDATHDILKYPVRVNYTIDSLAYAGSTDAYIEEAIIANFERIDSTNFSKQLPSNLVHECLHYIQSAKIDYILQQPEAKGLTFQQAYELAMCKEIAAHIGDQIAEELSNGKKIDIVDITKIANAETNRYLNGEGISQAYKNQYFDTACNIFDPNAAEGTDNTSFLKLKAAIMSQYININGQMKSVNLLPLLTDENAKLIQPPAGEMQKYENKNEEIKENRKKFQNKGISAAQKLRIMQRRFRMHTEKWDDSDPHPPNVRSGKLTMDVSRFFPTLSTEQFEQTQKMIDKMAQNEAAGNHSDNQDFLRQFINTKDKTVISIASLMAEKERVNQ